MAFEKRKKRNFLLWSINRAQILRNKSLFLLMPWKPIFVLTFTKRIQCRLKLVVKTSRFMLIDNCNEIVLICIYFSLSIHKRVIKVGDAFSTILFYLKARTRLCRYTNMDIVKLYGPMLSYGTQNVLQKNNTINMKKWDSKVTLYGFY